MLLPRDGAPTQSLARVRAGIAGDAGGLPHVLDLAVLDGGPVAVVVSGASAEQVDRLVALASGATAPAPAPPPQRGRTGLAPRAAVGAAAGLVAVAVLVAERGRATASAAAGGPPRAQTFAQAESQAGRLRPDLARRVALVVGQL